MSWRGPVERVSASVTEANAAAEVLMPVDTLRMLADHLYTVLMTFVEGESFDILVCFWTGKRARSLAASAQTMGPTRRREEEEDCSERSFLLDVPSWESCREQWNGWRT